MRWNETVLGLVCAAVVSSGCGGGGKGSSNPGPQPPSLTVSTTAVTVTTFPQNLSTTASATVDLTISGTIPTGGIYIGGNATNNGIQTIASSQTSSKSLTLTITFKDASSLAPGIYGDTITVVAATDQAGNNQIQNSPQSISTTYKVLYPQPQVALMSPASAYVGGPAFTLSLTGTGFRPNAQVFWDGTPMPTTYLSDTSITAAIPAQAVAAAGSPRITVGGPDVGTSVPMPFPIANAQAAFLNVPAMDIVWDRIHQVIYAANATIAASGPNTVAPNTILAIDPVSGQVKTSASTLGTAYPAPAGPMRLALSEDCNFLYAYIIENPANGNLLSEWSTIQRFTLPSLTLDTSFSIPFGSNSLGGEYDVSAMAVAPGAPHTLAIGRASSGWRDAGVAVFDDAIQRGPALVASSNGLPPNDLAWGTNASTLYATNSWSPVCEFMILNVNTGGSTLQLDLTNTLTEGVHDIHMIPSTGKIYVGNGQILDAATGQIVGACGSGWSGVALDPALGLAFFLDFSSPQPGGWSFNIRSYDLAHSTPVSTTFVPTLQFQYAPEYRPRKIIRCGPSTLALGGNGFPICLVTGPFAQGK
ncbi:hypothetical protein GETHLI_32440 [Geothrix limicola]|uniref:IPT/TIG domain-containing protein n=1 Tax=Geothrix limicola TaxID=2927978 RepID=A0ABQ5QJ84_9BACT|nr:hypothetical protein [Geothrix limicola]GLH74742.1 hypothetical protein GETHLI_32440 [Geothrix limicola]